MSLGLLWFGGDVLGTSVVVGRRWVVGSKWEGGCVGYCGCCDGDVGYGIWDMGYK